MSDLTQSVGNDTSGGSSPDDDEIKLLGRKVARHGEENFSGRGRRVDLGKLRDLVFVAAPGTLLVNSGGLLIYRDPEVIAEGIGWR
jgi:hypothetical protein